MATINQQIENLLSLSPDPNAQLEALQKIQKRAKELHTNLKKTNLRFALDVTLEEVMKLMLMPGNSMHPSANALFSFEDLKFLESLSYRVNQEFSDGK